jgi:RNA polymerase sigma-70 factor (ECF subfamily)
LPVPDRDIALQIRQGNVAVFEKAFKTHYAILCSYAIKFVWEKEQAEEIVQELFFNLWNKREMIDITTSFESYLFRAVRNACFNYLKHLKVRAEHHQQVLDSPKSGEDPSGNTFEILELQEKIDEAIDLMPPERKKIFLLSRFEGLKYREIANQLNISVKTVEAQMGKALEHMRKQLTGYLVLLILILLEFLVIIYLYG